MAPAVSTALHCAGRSPANLITPGCPLPQCSRWFPFVLTSLSVQFLLGHRSSLHTACTPPPDRSASGLSAESFRRPSGPCNESDSLFFFPHVGSLSLELLRRRSGLIEVVMSRRRSASYSSARLSNPSDSSEGETAQRNHPKPQNQLYSTGHHAPEIELQDIPPSRIDWHRGPDSDQAPQEVASSGVSGRSENGGHTRRRSRARSAANPPPPPEPEYPTVDHLPWYAHKYEYVRIPKLKLELWQRALY